MAKWLVFNIPLLVITLLCLRWVLRRRTPRWVMFLGAALHPGQLPLFNSPRPSSLGRIAFPITAFLLLTGLLGFIEVREPYFFSQDDNRSAVLPNMVPGCHSFWSGQMPQYNPYLGFGAPMMNRGLESYTYPPTHISYLFARFVLNNEYAMLEVWAFLHILGGFWATYFLGRYLGMRPWIATSIALAFVLSGQALIMGRSWLNFTPPLVWQPLMFLSFAHFIRGKVGFKWAFGMALSFGMFFHVGFPQLVILTLLPILIALAVLLALRFVPWRRLYWMVPAALFAAALCIPLFLQQWCLASELPQDSYGIGIGYGFLNMLVPVPLVNEPISINFLAQKPYAGQFYYFGTLFAVLAALAIFAAIVARVPRLMWLKHFWIIPLLVMADFCMGENGLTYPLLNRMGHANLWHYPWRAIPVVVLLAVIVGGLMLEGLIREKLIARPVQIGVGVLANLLLLYHATLPLPSFFDFGFKPYPPLPPELRNLVLNPDGSPNGRVWPVHPFRSTDPDYIFSLGLNFPTLYGVASGKIYDPIVERSYDYRSAISQIRREPLEAYRAFGIRWVIVSKTNPSLFTDGVAKGVDVSFLVKRLDHPSFDVYEVPDPSPFAFFPAQADAKLECSFDHGGAHIVLPASDKPRVLIANILSIPDLQAYADAQPIDITDEAWNRVKVTVPPGATKVAILYQPPWMRGVAMGGVLLVAGIYSGLRLSRKERTRPASRA